MIFPVLLAALGLWALFALRDRPPREYVRIYFACSMMSVVAEVLAFAVLRIYEWHMWLLPDQRVDLAATSLLVALVSPLMGVLFARHGQRHPVVKALAAAVLLGAMEWWMVATEHMIYLRFWHPLLTAGLFFAYFLLVRRVAAGGFRLPRWVDTHGVALMLGLLSDIVLGVIVGLWEYQGHWSGDPWLDGRELSALLHGLIYCPPATIVAAAPLRHRWIWAAGAILLPFVVEGALRISGLLVYSGWTVGLSLIRWAGVVSLTALYAMWIGRPRAA